MNRPAPEEHRLTIPVAEALLLRAPAWPAQRPPLPGMCCEHCLRAAVTWAWRCSRALHLMAFESYDGESDDESCGEVLPDCPFPWPGALPADLIDPRDFAEAAGACAGAAAWCAEAAVRLRTRLLQAAAASEHDRDLLDAARRHMATSSGQLRLLGGLFVGGARGAWQRPEAVSLADNMCHRLGEVVVAPWPRP